MNLKTYKHHNLVLYYENEFDDTTVSFNKDSITLNNFDNKGNKKQINLNDIDFNFKLIELVNYKEKEISEEMKKKITSEISGYLNKMGQISDKNQKRNLSLELMDCLLANKIFIDLHDKFKITVCKKFKQLYDDYITDQQRNKVLEIYLLLFHIKKIGKSITIKKNHPGYPLDNSNEFDFLQNNEVDYLLDN